MRACGPIRRLSTRTCNACGHDMHMFCLLGMAKLMADNRDRWAGTLIRLFQPGEETGDRAQGMVDDGLLERLCDRPGRMRMKRLSPAWLQ
jgi:metal-dependent amidase/aminoacylase/carboxypeptidase family protein